MKEIIVKGYEAGQRLDKFIMRLLPGLPSPLLYKQLRNKNITLNGKKADGRELIKEGEAVRIFFSDETYDKFSMAVKEEIKCVKPSDFPDIPVIYEDGDIVIFNKPQGVLSQKADNNDYSMNEYLREYLSQKGFAVNGYNPSVCNRLDRNTSGMILCAKTLYGARFLSDILKTHNLEKYYLAIVSGKVKENKDSVLYFEKDTGNNVSHISDSFFDGAEEIHTAFFPLSYNDTYSVSLLLVRLYTGKSHQIRAHLLHLGFPIIGDSKYGSAKRNKFFKEEFKLKYQALHAYKLVFPKSENALSGKKVYCEPGKIFKTLFGDVKWQHGIQED